MRQIMIYFWLTGITILGIGGTMVTHTVWAQGLPAVEVPKTLVDVQEYVINGGEVEIFYPDCERVFNDLSSQVDALTRDWGSQHREEATELANNLAQEISQKVAALYADVTEHYFLEILDDINEDIAEDWEGKYYAQTQEQLKAEIKLEFAKRQHFLYVAFSSDAITFKERIEALIKLVERVNQKHAEALRAAKGAVNQLEELLDTSV